MAKTQDETKLYWAVEARVISKNEIGDWTPQCNQGHTDLDKAKACFASKRDMLLRSRWPETPGECGFLGGILNEEKDGNKVEIRLVQFTTTREVIDNCNPRRVN